ncbi:nucleotidyltransferase family protein [Singulisphaera sp. PoT]|uniref:nucleotidyltransferase family protein n=1 Tax=Singulisphaera sp. PoT TaxID=3411797 RepID=UPI003BF46000
MGRPKLILPIDGQTVISRVVSTLIAGGIRQVIVVVPPIDAPGASILANEAEASGALVLVPSERPADMRGSFERALEHLLNGSSPASILLIPGDSLGIEASVVAGLIERASERPDSILIPTFQGRRGHPIVMPWALALGVQKLPEGAGINSLIALQAERVTEVEFDRPGVLDDLDTPDDYERWVEAR